MMKLENHPLLSAHLFFVVCIDEKCEGCSISARGRLDHIRNDFLFALLVEIFQSLAAKLRVLFEVEVRTIRNPFQFAPAHRKEILNVGSALGVVRQLVFLMLAQTKVLCAHAVLWIPSEALVDPSL